jgi:hypothetical protein
MRYQYVVTLKKDSEKTTDKLGFFLCFLSSIIFLFNALRTSGWFLYAAAIVLLAGLTVNVIATRTAGTRIRYRYLLLAAALGWMANPFLPWFGVFFVALAFLEYQTKRPLEIGFDKDRIVINSLIRRRYDWSDFSNIILRDGLLTMDFKDNHIFQKEVADEEDEDDADEEEFNDYCRLQLQEYSK